MKCNWILQLNHAPSFLFGGVRPTNARQRVPNILHKTTLLGTDKQRDSAETRDTCEVDQVLSDRVAAVVDEPCNACWVVWEVGTNADASSEVLNNEWKVEGGTWRWKNVN